MFAVAIDTDAAGNLNTLWEYNAANGGWSEISTGYFQQVSAATNAAGNAVVFGVLGQGGPSRGFANSLWEYSNGGWKDLAAPRAPDRVPPYTPGSSSSGSDRPVPSSPSAHGAQGEVAFAIASDDQSLYEYTPSGGWSHVSTGTFQQVSARPGRERPGRRLRSAETGPGQQRRLGVRQQRLDRWWPARVLAPRTHSTGSYWPTFTEWSVTAGRNGEVFALDGFPSRLMAYPITAAPRRHLWGYRQFGLDGTVERLFLPGQRDADIDRAPTWCSAR